MGILKDKHVVVTGGSGGIGLAIAEAFSNAGAELTLIGRDAVKLEAAVERIDGKVTLISRDLADLSRLDSLSDDILASGGVDVLVNNAGLALFKGFEEVSAADFDRVLDINVRSVYFLTQHLLSSLIERRGNILNISSYFAHKMIPQRPSTLYSLSKGALESFTRALAMEVGHMGVRVNAIAPGSVKTSMFERAMANMTRVERSVFEASLPSLYPLGRIGEPRDIAGMALLLCSPQSSWITGGVFPVDGGLTLT